jgi:hypothetical protein
VDLVVAWLLFPVVLLSLATGWGCAVTRLCRVRLPGELVPPLGFAAIVVVSGLVTLVPRAAQFATPVVVGGAAAGLAAAWPWTRPSRSAALPAVAATLVFAAYAAPILMSGSATYAGFLTLDDSATLFAMTDRMLEDGRTLDGLAPSTYEATLATSLMVGYPMGSLLPLGVGAQLVGEDVAWLFQPYLAVIAALLALVLWRVLSQGVPRSSWRLVAVVVAAQPAILYAYGLWTGVKELTAALLIALACALALERRDDVRVGAWLPLATAAAAAVGVLSLGGALWLLPLGVWMLVVGRPGLRVRNVVAAGAVLVVLALPAVAEAARFLGDGHLSSWRDQGRLANLLRPLSPLQVFGIWPAGDFRLRPESYWPTIVLVALVAVLAAAGLVRSVRSRDALLPYAGCAVVAAVVYWVLASPWIEAKSFAIASPALLALAASGCAWLAVSGRRVEAGVAAALVAGGVLWSNVLAYGDVNLAPRDQLAELEGIGRDFAGHGPSLMTEFEPVGVRHFLRRLDAEGASELRRRLVPLRNGTTLAKLEYANLDSFQLDALLAYRTLVLRRSPFESRPPAPYELRRRGTYYEVWQRPATFRPVVEHYPLGDSSHAGAVPSCARVLQLADRGSSVAAVVRDDSVLVLPLPAAGQMVPFTVPRRDRYSIWLAGSTRDQVDVLVDGRRIGGAGYHLSNRGQFVELAEAVIGPGKHVLELRFGRARLRPGVGGPDYGSGPVIVSVATPPRAVSVLPSPRASSLCGRTLDWVEALG